MGNKNDKIPLDTCNQLQRCTSFSNKQMNKWYKTFNKCCPEGRMTMDQFQKVYRYFFTEGDSTEFAKHVFRTFDKNQDGTIDFKEFMCGLSITKYGSREQKLMWAFNMTDIDSSGEIVKDELETVIRAMYQLMGHDCEGEVLSENGNSTKLPAANELADHLFKKIDINSDGQITLDEFLGVAATDADILSLFQQA